MFNRKRKKKEQETPLSAVLNYSAEEIELIVEKANIPAEMKELLINELPNLIERLDETAKQIYDPSSIWLEAMQYADYVSQLATHLNEGHGQECVSEIAEQLINMSESYKEMGENALRVIDENEGELDDGTQ